MGQSSIFTLVLWHALDTSLLYSQLSSQSLNLGIPCVAQDKGLTNYSVVVDGELVRELAMALRLSEQDFDNCQVLGRQGAQGIKRLTVVLLLSLVISPIEDFRGPS